MTGKLFQIATLDVSEREFSSESYATAAAREWAEQIWDGLGDRERTELERIKAQAPQFGRRTKCFGRRNSAKAAPQRSYPQTGYARFAVRPLAATGTR